MVVQPFTESQFTLILPPRSIASCRSVGGATPGGMFRLIAWFPVGRVMFSNRFGAAVVVDGVDDVVVGSWKKTFLSSSRSLTGCAGT